MIIRAIIIKPTYPTQYLPFLEIVIFQAVHTSTYSYFLTIAAVSIGLQDAEVIKAKLIIHMHPVDVKL